MTDKTASPFRPLCSPAIICLLLAVATLAVYWPVASHGFIDYDDDGYFFNNSHVLGGLTWANIKWAFTSGEYVNWHPLTWLSLMLDSQLFGHGATAPHITSILLHTANSILVFLLFLRLTGAIWRSAALAFLFALHPLHVESVAWVAERKDVLSAFFGLLTLLCYARYAQGNSQQNSKPASHSSLVTYHLSLFFFACGLMSKPMLVTFPFLLLLLDYWPLQRLSISSFGPSLSRIILEKIPFFLLAAAASVVTYLVQDRGGAVTPLSRFPMEMRIENIFVSYARYLARVFWPVNLATPYAALDYWPIYFVIFSMAIFVVLCVAAVVLWKKYPFLFTGWFWYAGMLVPVIGLVQVGAQAMADRYMYLPMIGILVIAVWGIGEICLRYKPPRPLMLSVAVILFLACVLRSRNQVGVWKDDGTLFSHAMATTKNNYIACLDLGYWYAKNGQITNSLDYYYLAARMSPADPTALYNTANAFAKLGQLDDAISIYHRALALSPDDPDILNNLGFALARSKQLPEAAQCFQGVIKLKPNSVEAHNNLAAILFMQGNIADAARQYQAALQLTPDDPRIIANLGDALVRLGQKSDAVQCYQRALQLEPNNATIRAKLQALGARAAN
jgi:Flp pilus assembly protein TadD